MAGLAGLSEAEKAIYDEFEKVTREALAKARADAAAIGADINAIIGPTEAAVVKAENWFVKSARAVWTWLIAWTNFLDDPRNGKFSHKRLLSVAFGVVAIRQLIIADYWGAILSGIGSIVLAVVSAVTKT
jgi:hypothetical protein